MSPPRRYPGWLVEELLVRAAQLEPDVEHTYPELLERLGVVCSDAGHRRPAIAFAQAGVTVSGRYTKRAARGGRRAVMLYTVAVPARVGWRPARPGLLDLDAPPDEPPAVPASGHTIRSASWGSDDVEARGAERVGIGPRPDVDRWDEARRVAVRLLLDMAGCRCPTPAAVWDESRTVLGVVHEELCPRRR